MKHMLSLKRAGLVAILALAWCALWGEVTAANAITGVLVGGAVVVSGLGTPAIGRVRIVPLARFAAVVGFDLVTSTASVGRDILGGTSRTEEAIVAVDLPGPSRAHQLLMIVAITLTPGTAVVDADPDTGTLYLHLLHAGQRDQVEAHVHLLSRLACEALPLNGRTGVDAAGNMNGNVNGMRERSPWSS